MDIKSSLPLLTAIRTGSIASGGAGLAATAQSVAGNAARIKDLAGAASGADGSFADAAGAGASFSQALGSALQGVSSAQNEAGAMQRDYQLGKPGASLEQAMIAMQTGQIQFQAAVTVRNRLVSAYTDIMNMPV